MLWYLVEPFSAEWDLRSHSGLAFIGKEFYCCSLKKKTTHIYAGDLGLIPGLGRSPGGGHGNPLQNSCLENSPWTEEPGEQQSMGSQESDMTERRSAHAQNK